MPYRSIEDPAKLRRLLEAALLLESDLGLSELLHHIVEEAISMTGASYGALGVLDEDHTGLAEFITMGIERDLEEQIGERPTGKGVLGLLIVDPNALRVREIESHPESYGFPPNHPPMTSFLGVPIKIRDEVFGNLYLTDKVGWSEFTADDEALTVALALVAGIAIENARLHEKAAKAAIYSDRDRMARDLHDTVIGRLFGSGLALQSIAGAIGDATLARRLDGVIADLDYAIRELRSTIYDIGSAQIDGGLRSRIVSVVDEHVTSLGFHPDVRFDGPVDDLSPRITEHLLATLREALTNVARHAEATGASVVVSVDEVTCRLEITDNGSGLDHDSGGSDHRGFGLNNMKQRAEKLQGNLSFTSPAAGGTTLIWEVPVAQERNGKYRGRYAVGFERSARDQQP